MKKIIVSLCFFLFTFSIVSAENYKQNKILKPFTNKKCKIIKVDDGDTFDLICENKNKKYKEYFANVRTIGINAPDLDYKKNGGVYKHCFYDESKKIIEKLKGRKLKVEFYGSDLCKDTYKGCRNLVRLIDYKTGKDINKILILKGYNFSWTNFSMIPKKIKISYKLAEKFAKKRKKGLWKKCKISYKYHKKIDISIPIKMTN